MKNSPLKRILAASREMEDSGVLEEPADDRSNANRLAESRDPGPQTAESPYDEIDRHASPRSLAERRDDGRILELVHLGDNARRPPGALMLDLAWR